MVVVRGISAIYRAIKNNLHFMFCNFEKALNGIFFRFFLLFQV